MRKIPHLRWWIVGMVFFASVLNYVDRQALSILAPTVQKELNLSNDDYAHVLNLFLVAYMFAYALSGFVVDKLGVRVSFALFVGWWSLANIFTGFARTVGSLGFCRFLLGLGEAGNWTAAPKAVAEWFPARERGIAVAIYTLGATIGATIAPILVVYLATRYGWQSAFVVTGVAGLLWLIPWLWLYRRPAEHPRLTDTERIHIADTGAATATPVPAAVEPGKTRWYHALRRREAWLLMVARLLTDPIWYFYQFWFAKYLYDVRGVDQAALSVTWIIFLAADFGALGGGWFSGLLIKRRHAPAVSRLLIMLGSAVIIPASAFLPHAPGLGLALAVGMLVVFAQLSWQINLTSLVVDTMPQRSLASLFGVIAAGSAMGGIFMNKGVAWAIANYSYTPCFYAMAVLHPLVWLLLWFVGRRPFRTEASPAAVAA